MTELSMVIAGVRSRIDCVHSSCRNSPKNAKVSLINSTVRVLAWNTEEADEVRGEYQVKSEDTPLVRPIAHYGMAGIGQ